MSMRQLKIAKSITSRESHVVDRYLSEISKLKVISPEDEIILASKFRKGNLKSLEELIKANLRFVISVAKQYQHQGMALADLINEGNFGLIRAGLYFDETKGFKFISYAVWWIRQGILQALADQSRLVRIPMNKIGLAGKINKAIGDFEQEFEREPTEEELAALIKVSKDDIRSALNASKIHISIDTPVSDDDELTIADTIENPNAEQADFKLDFHESLSKELAISMKILTERQKEVLCRFYGIGLEAPQSVEEIARRLNVTRERIRQIRDKAIHLLKSVNGINNLRVYLG